MIIKTLYCYEREEGKVTVSTEKPDCDYSLRYRLIADEDKELTNDLENFTTCVDVDSPDGWYEVKVKKAPTLDDFLIMGEESMQERGLM